MALRPVQLLGLILAAVLAAGPARAEDSRIDKAKKVRDEILEKRRGQPAGAAVRPDLPAASEPLHASIVAARERLALLDFQIEQKRRESEAAAAPRDKLQARSDELALQVNAIHEQNRARVEAVYRSAKLGAGAAGWHPEPARSARLSRYLASIADVQQKKLELVEIEHGSVIASLDKARADDASVRGELRTLDADRTEALASLERALGNAGAPRMAGLTPEEAEAEALAQEHALRGAQGAAGAALEEAAADSALAVERAMALLAARTGGKPSGEATGTGGEAAGAEAGETAGRPPDGEAAGDPGAEADTPAGGGQASGDGDFTWPSSVASGDLGPTAGAVAGSQADAEAEALAQAKAALEARAAEAKAAEDNTAEEAAAAAAEEKAAAEAEIAKAKAAEARAAEEAKAEAAKAEAAKAADQKAAAEAAQQAREKEEAHGTSGELEDGPAVLAPASPPAAEQAASAPAQPGGEPEAGSEASETDQTKRPNLFSRMFGGDRESDAFAASRGSLPPPVAGKVVANYGQQHKSGATYRGVILRAGHSAPIQAVAGGKVSFAGNVPGLGNTVIVSHGGRYHTVYARLGTLDVKEGESVARGTGIGALPADNADMHFELRDRGKAVDPVPWLKGGIPGAAQ